ncbi:LysR substrate-binding domain-containing protein [Pantoea sp. 18069]|uniref:LysR substrate-binding domain-containing protein n=1 Tax=Pantoea sp. 18069 TaxID=2681415 RepID=UPI00135A263A|nr:LysR substrate-binding domain-containing protein [Pantoea sp. 18069]
MPASPLDWYLQVNLKARQLRLLIALDDFGNLKQVAEISHITVSAVSKALSELEKGLGLQLFARTPQGLQPTAYGECLIRHARSMLVNIHHAREELRAISTGTEGKIHVGVFPAWTSVLLPTALALLKERSPGTNVLVTEGTIQTLMPELLQGNINLLIGRLPSRHASQDVQELELLKEPLVLMTGPNHPLAKQKKVKWADMKNYPWVLPPAGSQLREPLEHILERHDISLSSNYIETLSTHLIRSYLHMTNAIAMMAAAAAKDPIQPLNVLPLTLPRLMRPAGVMWNRSRTLTPGAQHLVACLKEVAESL